MNVFWRWLVPPVVLVTVGIGIVVAFSYATIGGPPRFMGGVPLGAPQMRGAPIGTVQGGDPARSAARGRDSRERRDGRDGHESMGSEGPGGVGPIVGKSLLLIGLPMLITFGASWYLFRSSGASPEMTTIGEVPVEE